MPVTESRIAGLVSVALAPLSPTCTSRRSKRDRLLKRSGPLALALLLDARYGEPPAQLHPVVWMGRLLDWLDAHAPHDDAARFLYGATVALAVPLGWAWLARAFCSLAVASA